MRSHVVGIVTAVAVCTLIAGCGDAPPPIEATFNITPSKVFQGPEGVGRSLQQQATEASLQVINDYLVLKAKLMTTSQGSAADLKNVTMDPDPLKQYDGLSGAAIGGMPMLTTATADVNAARKAKWKGDGGTEIVSNASVTNWEAPADSSGRATEGMAFTEIRACVDVSGFKPLLPSGKPAYDQNRRPQHLQKFLVMNPKWPDRSGWRIATQYTRNESPCTAA